GRRARPRRAGAEPTRPPRSGRGPAGRGARGRERPPRPRARAPACCRTTARRGGRVRRESMLPTLLCCHGPSGKVTTHMLTAALDYTPADPRLLVTARDPFCDEHGFRLSLALAGDVPGGLTALGDVFHGGQPEARSHVR